MEVTIVVVIGWGIFAVIFAGLFGTVLVATACSIGRWVQQVVWEWRMRRAPMEEE